MNIEILKTKRNKLKDESIEIIKELLNKDWSYTKIAKYLKVSPSQVCQICKNNHLLSRKSYRLIELNKLRNTNQFQCRLCDNIFSLSDLISDKDYLCKSCISLDRKRHSHNLGFEQQISKKLIAARIKSKHCNREFKLTKSDIIELWNKQNGKCYYSGLEMSHKTNDKLIFSIDRIDSDKGYNINNIVLCCLIFNTMKLNYSQSEFIEYCKLVANHN